MTDPSPASPPPVETVDPGPRGRLALAVAAAVDAVPGARRGGNGGVPVGTQYRGGRVTGVGLGADRIDVRVIAESSDLAGVARDAYAAARRALDVIGDPRPVSVIIEDLHIDSLSGDRSW